MDRSLQHKRKHKIIIRGFCYEKIRWFDPGPLIKLTLSLNDHRIGIIFIVLYNLWCFPGWYCRVKYTNSFCYYELSQHANIFERWMEIKLRTTNATKMYSRWFHIPLMWHSALLFLERGAHQGITPESPTQTSPSLQVSDSPLLPIRIKLLGKKSGQSDSNTYGTLFYGTISRWITVYCGFNWWVRFFFSYCSIFVSHQSHGDCRAYK